MPDPTEAYVAHRAPLRVRLRVAAARRSTAELEHIRSRVSELPGVHHVSVNPSTGSILIQGPNAEEALKRATAAGILKLHDSRHQERSASLRGEISQLDRLALRNFVVAGLVVGGVAQIFRGRALSPATTLFWYGGTVLNLWRGMQDTTATNEGRPSVVL